MSIGKKPRISVIIPVFNDTAGLASCLTALMKQSLPPTEYEVIVVDNASSVPVRDAISEFHSVRVVDEPRPGSYRARNSGYRAATADVLAFTDADCLPDTEWLSKSLEYLDSHSGTGAIAGHIELTSSKRPTPAELYERVFAFRQERYVAEYGFAATANLIVRRDVFEKVGPFNGEVKSGGDRDWGNRMHLAGYGMEYVREVTVQHPARSSIASLISKRRRLEGGHRSVPRYQEINPDWKPRYVSNRPRGMGMAWALLFQPSRLDLREDEGLKVLIVAGVLVLVGLMERLRLLVGLDAVR